MCLRTFPRGPKGGFMSLSLVSPHQICSTLRKSQPNVGSSMDIETKNAVELFFPNPAFYLIYFDAIAASVDAGATDVTLFIESDASAKPQTLRLTISDNGAGFTDDSFARFERLLKPQDQYHKGLG